MIRSLKILGRRKPKLCSLRFNNTEQYTGHPTQDTLSDMVHESSQSHILEVYQVGDPWPIKRLKVHGRKWYQDKADSGGATEEAIAKV